VTQGDEYGGLAYGGTVIGAWDAPGLALAESFPRRMATAESPNLNSGTLTCTAIGLPPGTPVSAITLFSGHSAASGPSHGWFCLMNSACVILAASADQGSAAWPALTGITLPMTSTVVTRFGGIYYVAASITATLPPNFASTPMQITAGIAALVPLLSGSSSTGLSGPPAVGTQMSAISAPTGYPLYAIVS
jgi:hypothetical protein